MDGLCFLKYWVSCYYDDMQPLDVGQVITATEDRPLRVEVLMLLYDGKGRATTLPGYEKVWERMLEEIECGDSVLAGVAGMGQQFPDILWKQLPLGGCSSFRILTNAEGALPAELGLGTLENINREVRADLAWADIESFMGSEEDLRSSVTLLDVAGNIVVPSGAPMPQFVVEDEQGTLRGWDVEQKQELRYSPAPIPICIGESLDVDQFEEESRPDPLYDRAAHWLNGRTLRLGMNLSEAAPKPALRTSECWEEGVITSSAKAQTEVWDSITRRQLSVLHGTTQTATNRLASAKRRPGPSLQVGDLSAQLGVW